MIEASKKDITPLIQEICDSYTLAELSLLYKEYLRGQVLIQASHPAISEFLQDARTALVPDKVRIATLYALIVTDNILAQSFLNYLHDPVYAMLKKVVWIGPIPAAEEKVKAVEDITTIQFSEDSVLPSQAMARPEYSLLALDEFTPPLIRRVQTSRAPRFQNVWFVLPTLLTQAYRMFVKAPESSELVSTNEIPSSKQAWIVYENEGRTAEIIGDAIPRILAECYVEECTYPGSLQRKKSKTISSMFGLPELYPDSKENDTINMNMLTWLILWSFAGKGLQLPQGIEAIQRCFDAITSYEIPVHEYLMHFVIDHNHANSAREICAAIPSLLKIFPDQEWVEVELLINRTMMHGIVPSYYRECPAPEDATYIDLSAYDKPPIDPIVLREALQPTFMRGLLGFLGSLGLLDFLMEIPNNLQYQLKGVKYLSPFDGLRFVRLTELGEIVIGRKSIDEPLTKKQEEHPYVLDTQRLLISVKGTAAHRQLALAPYAKRMGNSFFMVEPNVFIKGCNTVKELEKKVMQFKQLVHQELPDNWEQFFNTLVKQANSIVPEPMDTVFKLKDQGQLAELFATDAELKLLVKRAEGFKIIVARADINRLKKRLGELGYFIE